MRSISSASLLFTLVSFNFVLLISATLSPLRAQNDSTADTPPPTADTPAQPMPDQGTPAPDQGTPAPDQGQGFTSDDATGATQGDASFQTFYDALSDQGTWVQSNDYGYVWQPQVNDANWAPYTQGHWAYTDDGWTWVSDEQFGWATYHYGRWVNLDGYGWVWVPGYTWAPAWVSWRYGDGYAGWAPLPPDSFVGVDYSDGESSDDFGYHIGGDADSYYGIGPAIYIFLPVNCLCYHDYHGYYCDRHDNWHYINHTSNVTNINVSHHHGGSSVAANPADKHVGRFGRVIVGGPKLADVNAVSQTPIQKVTLTHTTQRGGGMINGNTLALYAPHVNAATTGTSLQPSRVSGTIAQARINHGTDITRPLAVNSRLTPPPATEAQVQQAHLAQSQTPPEAKVLTDETAVKPVLQRPLTAMRPVATTPHPGNVAPGGSSSATYRTPQLSSTPGYAPAPTYTPTPSQTYAPTRVYPQTGGNEATPSRTYAPPSVYPTQPHGAVVPQQSAPTRNYPTESGGGSAGEPHIYVRPTTPAPAEPSTPAPQYHSSPAPAASSGGSESTRTAPSSSGSSTAPSTSSPGSGTSNNGKNH